MKYLENNPHPLGSAECWKFEKSRHDSTVFGSMADRDMSYDRIHQAIVAWMNKRRENMKSLHSKCEDSTTDAAR